MELRQLRYFVRIVELGSLSRAARDLHIAQPALSQQLANLEGELGLRLLARSVRGVTATEAGQVFYRHAHSIQRQMERLKTDVQHVGAQPTGEVSIGMPTSVANVLATPLIVATRDRYPGVRLQIIEGLSGHLKELVANGRVEMSLLFDYEDSSPTSMGSGHATLAPLRITPLLQEELFLLTMGTRRFGRQITLAQAAGYDFVLPGPANSMRQFVDRVFRSAELPLNVVAELDSLATIKSVVSTGLGATILSASALLGATKHDGVSAHRISDRELSRDVSLCTYDIVPLSAAAECLWKLILEVSASLIRNGVWVGAKPNKRIGVEP
ncbi:MAG: LysR family transcriptional regulator [Variovorax sp.]|nr:MAG: LysR family transcriptional regulator [Variovorax sp.]